jgi:putative FmdB family regulatory protein
MPVYEYYCEDCDGVFEAIRPMREASADVPCVVCNRDARRIMPTTFMAFSFRDGYARRIPDRGTYWHLGKEVKRPVTGSVPPNEHPDLYKPTPPKVKTAGELAIEDDKQALEAKEKELKKDYQSISPAGKSDIKDSEVLWKDFQQGLHKDDKKKIV